MLCFINFDQFVLLLQKIELEIKTAIDTASKQAREDKEVELEELSADVYSKPLEAVARGVLPWHAWPLKTLNKPEHLN